MLCRDISHLFKDYLVSIYFKCTTFVIEIENVCFHGNTPPSCIKGQGANYYYFQSYFIQGSYE